MARGFGGVGPVGRTQRANAVVISGVVVALVCVVVAFWLLSIRDTTASTKTVVVEKDAPIKMVDVLVPTSDIAMGQPLEPSMFRRESRPAIAVDPRSVREYEELTGHFSRSLIVANQPLHRDMITSVRPSNALTASIPEGYRAVTIRVDARTSVEGFTRPGARVDVTWSSKIKGRPGVKVIVQNAKVLSAERQTAEQVKPGAPIPSTVTLLVVAKDAAKIQLASTTGSLSLSLRGDTDNIGTAVDEITINDLLDATEGDDPDSRKTGTVLIDGKKFIVVPGKGMIPAGN